MKIALLADLPEAVDRLAGWYRRAWGEMLSRRGWREPGRVRLLNGEVGKT